MISIIHGLNVISLVVILSFFVFSDRLPMFFERPLREQFIVTICSIATQLEGAPDRH